MDGGKFWIKFPFRAVVDKIESKPKFNQCELIPVILPNLKIQIITGARNSTTIFGQSQRDTTNEKTTISGITSQYFFKTRSGMDKYNI